MRKGFLLACLSLFMSGGVWAQSDVPNVDTEVTNQYITNADLSGEYKGWTKTGFNSTGSGNGCHVAEAYAGWGNLEIPSYSLKQDITLPKGSYRLVNYSFFRQGVARDTDPTKSLGYLVAGDERVALKTLGGTELGWYANSIAEAAGFFSQEIYENEVVFEVTSESQTLSIGLEGSFDVKQSWCIAGPFHLYKVGKAKYDLTSLVVNNGFENDLTGWTVVGEWQRQDNSWAGKFGGRFAEKWQGSGGLPDGKLSQTLTEMPVGYYRLTASVHSTGTGTYLFANSDRTEATENTIISVETEVTDGTLEFGYVRDNTTANWVCIDNVKLYYLGNATEAVAQVYNDVKAKVDLLDAAGQAKFAELTATIKAAIDAETVTGAQKDGYIADIQAAYIPSVKAQTTPDRDWTELVVNPSFEDNFTGWTNTGMAAQGNTSFGKTGSKYAEKWEPNGTFGVEQTIAGLPEAVYTITVRAKARSMESASLYAGNGSTAMTIDDNERDYSVTLATSGDLKIGATGVGTGVGASWFCLDNFRLTYVGSVADYLNNVIAAATVDTSKPMNGAFRTTYTTALAAANTAKTSGTAAEKYAAAQALDAAIVAVNASIVDYANNKAIIDEIESMTNIFSAEAKATLDGYKAAYEGETATDALNRGSRVDGVMPTALLSAWNVDGYYINTWSTEGNNDGSNFRNPFYEYWVSDANALAAKNLTATQAGLVPGKMYKVSAWTRVRARNGASTPEGITLQVGEGKSVNVCAGSRIGTSQMYIGEFEAVGAADEDGKLTVTYSVADGTNVSWLSFKNIFYSEAVAADVTELNAAIAAAEAKALGFEAGDFAPYNNVAALEALAAAKDANGYEPQAEIDALTDALTGAVWTANTEEVNAIYDGSFTEYAYKEDGSREQAFAWTGSAGHNSADDVRHMYYTESNPGMEGKEALFIKFGVSYGLTEGYTMPLKANTAYKLTFTYGGWGAGEGNVSNAGKGITVTDPNGDAIELTPATIYATEGANANAEAWKEYTGVFVTGETAGDYILNFNHKRSGGQDQYVFTNIELKKAPMASATMSIGTAQYATFIAPFDVEVPAGVTASKVTGIGEDNTTLALENIAGAIPANTPVVLYSENAVSETFNGQSIAVKNEYTEGLLTGVYAATGAPEGSYVLQSHDGVVGFYEVAETKPTVGANRAYLTVPAEAAAVKAFYFDNATGVNAVEGVEKSDAIYDLSGRRVSNAVKGIYIINGKKVLK